ncbi:MAG TPA: right-handed parallel beta-helix repeat-containing protein [Cytophagaceae bacterium]|nr:right-handed parallel beta-helix repeat-containing protein [Cytophagaceae bacterium]
MNTRIFLKVLLVLFIFSCQENSSVENNTISDTTSSKMTENKKEDSLSIDSISTISTEIYEKMLTGYFTGIEWDDCAYFKILDTTGIEYDFPILDYSNVDSDLYSNNNFIGKKIKIYLHKIRMKLPQPNQTEEKEIIVRLEDADFDDLKLRDKFKPKIRFLGLKNYKVYTSIQDAMVDAKEESELIIYPGTYFSDKQIMIAKDKISIIGIGKPLVLCKSMTQNVFNITSDDVTVQNIYASHVKSNTHTNCTGNVFSISNADNTTIENCDINGCGRVGVYIKGTGNLVLKNNFIHDNSLCAVQLEGINYNEPFVSEDVVFINNRMEKNGKK